MKVLDLLVLFLLVVTLIFGIYVMWYYLPYGETQRGSFVANISSQISGNVQFYPDMRYRDRVISYEIDSRCDDRKRANIMRAFQYVSSKSVLTFYEEDNGEIKVLCSDIAPSSEEKSHFVAGEGGPSEIINTSRFFVILSGKISLYRNERCDEPNVAIHEILHALGFDHNNNSESILYPVTACEQDIDEYVIREIDRLYALDSNPDLLVYSVDANKVARYLNFEIVIANYGLKNSTNSILSVYADNEKVREVFLGEMGIGIKKIISVTNLAISRDSSSVSFKIESPEQEISKENNIAEVEF